MRKRILIYFLVTAFIFTAFGFTAAADTEAQSSSVLKTENGLTAYGQFVISVLDNGVWKEAGKLSFGKYISTQNLEIKNPVKPGENVKLKFTQQGGGAAYLDAVTLDGSRPLKVNESNELTKGEPLYKLSAKDMDLVGVEYNGIVIEFSGENAGKLEVSGRIENKTISKEPFKFPVINNYKAITQDSVFYSYTINSNYYRLNIDGNMDNIGNKPMLFTELCRPGSGHPEGNTYCWVFNDDNYLYALLDFTSDNTMDGDKDYSGLYIKTEKGIKFFKITASDSQWGKAGFTYTDKVTYQHKLYEFKIPLSEIDKEDGILQIAFSLYGTAALPVFDKNPFMSEEQIIITSVPGSSIISVSLDDSDLPADSYIIEDNRIIIKKSYLLEFSPGDVLDFLAEDNSSGVHLLSVRVIQTPVISESLVVMDKDDPQDANINIIQGSSAIYGVYTDADINYKIYDNINTGTLEGKSYRKYDTNSLLRLWRDEPFTETGSYNLDVECGDNYDPQITLGIIQDGWKNIGSDYITDNWAQFVNLKVYNGIPYVAFEDSHEDGKVMKYDTGTGTWKQLGDKFSTENAMYISMELDNNGNPIVAYSDNGIGEIALFDSNSNTWNYLEPFGNNVQYVSMCISDSRIYAAYQDKDAGNMGKLAYYEYDESYGWQLIQCGTFTAIQSAYNISISQFENKVLIGYTEGNQVYAKIYDGTWQNVGIGAIANNAGGKISVKLLHDYYSSRLIPCAAYTDISSGKIVLKSFNEDTQKWVDMVSGPLYSGNPPLNSIYLLGNDGHYTPYFAHSDDAGDVYLLKPGEGSQDIFGGPIDDVQPGDLSLSFNETSGDEEPYIAYTDGNNENRLIVAKWDTTPPYASATDIEDGILGAGNHFFIYFSEQLDFLSRQNIETALDTAAEATLYFEWNAYGLYVENQTQESIVFNGNISADLVDIAGNCTNNALILQPTVPLP